MEVRRELTLQPEAGLRKQLGQRVRLLLWQQERHSEEKLKNSVSERIVQLCNPVKSSQLNVHLSASFLQSFQTTVSLLSCHRDGLIGFYPQHYHGL